MLLTHNLPGPYPYGHYYTILIVYTYRSHKLFILTFHFNCGNVSSSTTTRNTIINEPPQESNTHKMVECNRPLSPVKSTNHIGLDITFYILTLNYKI